MEIKEISKEEAIGFVREYHYSKVMPRINKYYLGAFVENELKGVVVLSWGTQPLGSIRKIFYKHKLTTKDYLEIGKMCFLPECNHSNFGSQFLKGVVRWMKLNTNCKFLYTLADGIMSKCGIVYQSANFQYIGKFKTSVYKDINTGEKIHPRSAKVLLDENAKLDGVNKRHWLTHNFCSLKGIEKINGFMFRYILPLNKQGKQILAGYPEYQVLKYPKGKDLKFWRRIDNKKYVEIPAPKFNMDVLNYNKQR